MPERYFAVHASRLLAVYNAAIWRGFRAFIGQMGVRVMICREREVCVRKHRGSGDAVVKIAVHAVLFNAIVAVNLASPAFAQGAGSADASGVAGSQIAVRQHPLPVFDGASDKLPSANVVRCDIKSIGNLLHAGRRSCDLEWGQAFEINDRAGRRSGCRYGDTVMDPRLPVLHYGSAWQRGGVACKSEESGVSCVNAAGNGFALSRNAQRLF